MKGSTNAPTRSMEIVAPDGRHVQPERRTRLSDLVERMMADVVLSHVCGQRTLDVGRGAHRLCEWVEQRAATLTVLDANDLGRGADVQLPLPSSSFDVVYCVRTLAHVGRDEETSISAAHALLREVARLLRDDGTALVQFENPRSLWGLYNGLRKPATVVETGPLIVDSSRGVTRFDTLGRFKRMLPRSLHLARLHGFGVAAHAPSLLHVPVLGAALERFEWFARDRRLLGMFGAHILVELRKVE